MKHNCRCINCGCTDSQACEGGCYWLIVDRKAGTGVCSKCPQGLDKKVRGWGVTIERQDGSKFLASSVVGILPAVWTHSQRRFAVDHKQTLQTQGFKARVVAVEFTHPRVVMPVANS